MNSIQTPEKDSKITQTTDLVAKKCIAEMLVTIIIFKKA